MVGGRVGRHRRQRIGQTVPCRRVSPEQASGDLANTPTPVRAFCSPVAGDRHCASSPAWRPFSPSQCAAALSLIPCLNADHDWTYLVSPEWWLCWALPILLLRPGARRRQVTLRCFKSYVRADLFRERILRWRSWRPGVDKTKWPRVWSSRIHISVTFRRVASEKIPDKSQTFDTNHGPENTPPQNSAAPALRNAGTPDAL